MINLILLMLISLIKMEFTLDGIPHTKMLALSGIQSESI